MLEVAEELAVALGLALLGAAQHGEELAHGLARQDHLQELDDLADVREIDVEVRAREAEEHAHGAFVEHHRVDQHAAIGIAQRDHERHRPAATADPPDEVGAGHLVEDFLDDLERLDAAPLALELERRLDLVGDAADAVVEIAIRRAEAEISQQFLDQQIGRAAVDVLLGLDVRVDAGQGVEIERDEFDRGIDADRAEGPARHRAEERLRELVVRQRIDDLREPPLDRRPDGALAHVFAEPVTHHLDGAVDVAVVEIDPLDRVLLAAAPVPVLEALARALRDRAELGVVVRERIDERLRAASDELVAAAGVRGSVVHLHRPGSAAFRLCTAAIRGCGSRRRRIRCT